MACVINNRFLQRNLQRIIAKSHLSIKTVEQMYLEIHSIVSNSTTLTSYYSWIVPNTRYITLIVIRSYEFPI